MYRNCKLHPSIHMGNVCASRDCSNPQRTDATMTKATLPSSSYETEKDRRDDIFAMLASLSEKCHCGRREREIVRGRGRSAITFAVAAAFVDLAAAKGRRRTAATPLKQRRTRTNGESPDRRSKVEGGLNSYVKTLCYRLSSFSSFETD